MSIARSAWLSALAAFEAAARQQNFAHAAAELHLTASAVSHQVRKLESLLGVTLFKRHARGVSLTPAGRMLADAAGNALADLDGIFGALRPRSDVVRIRIATLHSFAHSWLLPRLGDFTRQHPDIRLSVETDIALARFDDDGPDLAIRHGPGQWPDMSAQHLLDETLFPVASPDLPGVQEVGEAGDIARLPLIADMARQGWRDWFSAAGHRGVRLADMHTFVDSTDALQAAVCGLGATLARERIVAPWLADGRLVRLPGPVLPGRFAYYLVHPAHRRLSEPAALFARWLHERARENA
ncbi:LysR substrate-binding domain-containing protein [Pseudofulvimonas gallinarii]|jgi:LysR family glycine cleavage system transcriptional activator|uniref:Transcriptional regulator /LysR family transcriptional regulator n=1 Tax=Pseudofulvimonas gallinarii TaxID=634155 RepID=A0A4S3KTT7_9GAMM|nr:LysR substrate-binding domain-containing protein [Pseudofulvimonas gallinarii]TCT01420.1 transcriptional regulator /LysR family transcriptional regulator [Pseudofulvimonas gallinarii]THD12592.1 LysR family transcriptional regulator [Pseudofulvimonas gallinarii]